MDEVPKTWRNGKLVPLTEKLRREDLERVSASFVDPPPAIYKPCSKAERRRAKLHIYWDGVPWYARFLQVVVSIITGENFGKDK